eukprot:4191726-Alexandrium_andersonii.AAC.1
MAQRSRPFRMTCHIERVNIAHGFERWYQGCSCSGQILLHAYLRDVRSLAMSGLEHRIEVVPCRRSSNSTAA